MWEGLGAFGVLDLGFGAVSVGCGTAWIGTGDGPASGLVLHTLHTLEDFITEWLSCSFLDMGVA